MVKITLFFSSCLLAGILLTTGCEKITDDTTTPTSHQSQTDNHRTDPQPTDTTSNDAGKTDGNNTGKTDNSNQGDSGNSGNENSSTGDIDPAFSVASAMADPEGTVITVEGYIVGTAKRSMKNLETHAPFTNKSNLIIADTPGETNTALMFSVQLKSGHMQTVLCLKNHPENYGKILHVTGIRKKYIGIPGVVDVADYSLK
ncbi:DUF6359 domain-containing protein [Prevotella sp. AGR2160]|uniref:DUF6359 domain-containing protein n=1 Tax=Prevotella sp. AGR2160 TaxID=1280674 RepID=UPI00056C3478|nr:DUF6359 domain-containing protein [Prevotella sp. AGR2160]